MRRWRWGSKPRVELLARGQGAAELAADTSGFGTIFLDLIGEPQPVPPGKETMRLLQIDRYTASWRARRDSNPRPPV